MYDWMNVFFPCKWNGFNTYKLQKKFKTKPQKNLLKLKQNEIHVHQAIQIVIKIEANF